MSAIISDDGLYRYRLRRDLPPTFANRKKDAVTCTFIMLNPSTADADDDDPTIRRCSGFAASLRCTRLEVVNLYGYRATDPAELHTVDDPEGPENTLHLRVALSTPGPTIAAWGTLAPPDRVAKILAMPGADNLYCLGTNQDGSPRHPLYLRADAAIRTFLPYSRDNRSQR
ncbi:UNVERIFIED_CONTAM: hypothetical protein DES50_11131 [Williamsia faeni]